MALGIALLAASAAAAAADVGGYLAVTSDYVFRGVSYSDGHAAVQGGLDAASDSGLYAGLWLSSLDIETPFTARDTEFVLYAGYAMDVATDWSVGVSIVRYGYPGARGPVNYDYEEFSASVNYRDRAWLEYAYSPDIFHSSRETHNVELYAEWPLPAQLTLGAGIGWFDVSALSGDAYSYWQVGVSRPAGRFVLDLRFHDTSRAVAKVSDNERAESRIVLSLRYPFSLTGS